jgi:hypothetical protein
MAQLKDTTYASNTTVASSGSNVLQPPRVASANTGITNYNNLVYVTTGRAPDGGDIIQVAYIGGTARYVKYITYGP